MPKRRIIEDDEEDNEAHQDNDSDSDEDEAGEREQMKRCEVELVKKVVHCILATCTKRGHCRDAEFAQIFTNRNERNMKEAVFRKMKKQMKHVFGIKVDRDDENKRFYISNGLNSNFGMRLAEKLEKDRKKAAAAASDQEDTSEDEDAPNTSKGRQKRNQQPGTASDFENPHFRHWVLTSTLMFIYMTKRHTTTENQMEKGIDGVLIKNFLNNLFETFGVNLLTEKQYGELLGPAKSALFVSQSWLNRDIHNDPATGLEEVFYSWGPRAEMVVNKKEMLEEFCRIYGGKIQDWPNHAKIAGIRRLGRE